MYKINSLSSLQSAIIELERKHEEEGRQLKEQLLHTYEGLKPINIIKNAFKEAAVSKELKDNIINTAIGLASGFVYNMVIEKVTNTPLKKILSTALMAGITVAVEKNSDTFKLIGNELMKLFKKKKGEDKLELDNDEAN